MPWSNEVHIGSCHNEAQVFTKADWGPASRMPTLEKNSRRKILANRFHGFTEFRLAMFSSCLRTCNSRIRWTDPARIALFFAATDSFSDKLNSHRSYDRATRQPWIRDVLQGETSWFGGRSLRCFSGVRVTVIDSQRLTFWLYVWNFCLLPVTLYLALLSYSRQCVYFNTVTGMCRETEAISASRSR